MFMRRFNRFYLIIAIVLLGYSYCWVHNYYYDVYLPQQSVQASIVEIQRKSIQPLELNLPPDPTQGIPMPPPPQKGRVDGESSGPTKPKVITRSDATIELEAEGIKLRLINEASSAMIFQFCFVWLFCLITVFAYRYWSARLIPK